MNPIHPPTTPPPCGCENCSCRRGPSCQCAAYNALLALALCDFSRAVRRQLSPLARARP